jgi:Tfp pilus assembly protein FimT
MATRPASPQKSGSRNQPAPTDDPGKEWPVAEVVTGIIIVLIIVFLGLPKLAHWWHDYQINQDVVSFHDKLTMAKNTAVEKRNPVYVTFHPEQNTYAIHEDKNNNQKVDDGEFHQVFQLGEHLRYATQAGQDLKGVWAGKPVTEGPVRLLRGGRRLIFDPLGQASDNGTVYLIPTEDIGVTKDHMRALQIHKTTGEIRIRRYTGEGNIPWD